ncbi:MAG: sulfotransferase domain-containing protein [Chloroflexi bacterium]|nr:sulfotransferase domain-containing protein [Chloroflexota bacterium]
MPIHFLVSMPRSGTSALGTMIDQMTDVTYLGETFVDPQNGTPRQERYWYYNFDFSAGMRGQDSKQKIRSFLNSLRNCVGQIVVDFKTFQIIRLLGDHGFDELREIAGEMNSGMVYLLRSPLACFYSAYNARASGVFHTTDRRKITPNIKIAFDLPKFEEYLDFARRFWDHAAETIEYYPRAALVHYESLFASDRELSAATLSAIESIFGASGLKGKKPFFVKRMTSGTYDDVIINYKEAQNMLCKKGFPGLTAKAYPRRSGSIIS